MSDHTAVFKALADKLEQLETAQSELESYHARVTRAAADEEAVLADDALSEHECVKRLSDAQKVQAIYSARIGHRERMVTKLTSELEETLNFGERELNGLINDEVEKRTAILKTRILAVLGREEANFECREELAILLDQAAAIQAVTKERPGTYYQAGSPERAASTSRALLASYQTFQAECQQGVL